QSAFWQGLWRAFGTRILMTTAYHPQGNGAAERKNQSVELAIRYHYANNPEGNWIDVIPALQWHLNNAHSSAVGASPHEILVRTKTARTARVVDHRCCRGVGTGPGAVSELRRPARGGDR